MHSNNYTLGFVFIVTVILGTLLSFTKENVRHLQEYNLKEKYFTITRFCRNRK